MINFLKETINDIATWMRDPEDIVFIGSRAGYQCNWDEFLTLADFNYNNGYGRQEIASDLIIVFSDGAFMERREYDGAEWWELVKPFKMPKQRMTIRQLKSSEYPNTLHAINK